MRTNSVLRAGILRAAKALHDEASARAGARMAVWMVSGSSRPSAARNRATVEMGTNDELIRLRSTVARLEERVRRLETLLSANESGFKHLARVFGPVEDDDLEPRDRQIDLPPDLIARLLAE
jgi:hypothetical protein